ncbi:right-handed parallel beta-helix repeat-containing protein [Acaryochloris sp. 'Moss Beach']|uniref:right-handed parallel beta-helix repeat-containing protein n=1 Tax=Acaryochloris TaxID=155977 RepID=UPI001BAE68EB|nr:MULTISPECIES: right-handed parallel beta-helix repeat-containing protein [Acaryochloris]QUY44686.1 right-handed parallel beta-helix repeat-containing protein [Acaryochloris marina S15]UJB69453.1 right-handed parallel beta-helix repeat-containing protein [Acaryochloris sp. 'Moss Beach']
MRYNKLPLILLSFLLAICLWGLSPWTLRAESNHPLVVAQQQSSASDRNPGTENKPFRTINAAAQQAQPGDTILVHAGIYRERVIPPRSGNPDQPIVYEAVPGETVVLRGSEVWSATPVSADASTTSSAYWEGPLPKQLFPDPDPFTKQLERMPEGYLRGQVFCQSLPLRQVLDQKTLTAQPGAWYFDPQKRWLRVHLDQAYPVSKPPFLEVSTRRAVFAPKIRGLGYIHVKGFVMEHGANPFPSGFWRSQSPQAGILSTRSGHHWLIENNTVRFAKSLGIDSGSEGRYDIDGLEQPIPEGVGYHVIRNNRVTDNGAGGIAGWKQTESLIAYNVIERNNRLGFTAPETGGIKVHGFVDGQIIGNVLRNNECFGIWVDNVYRNARVSRNLVLGNQGAGIFVELGGGPILVDNNVVAFTKLGEGIYTHDASGVTLAHNWLQANTHFGIYMRTVTDRRYAKADGTPEQAGTRGQRIYGNVLVDNYRGHMSLPYPMEPEIDNKSDYNLLINGTLWQWAGQAPQQFVWNHRSKFVKRERIVATLKKAFETGQLPKAEQPNFDQWSQTLALPLPWWQQLTGNDTNSIAPLIQGGEVVNGAIAQGAITLGVSTPNLDVADPAVFPQLAIPTLPLPSQDFWGTPINNSPRFPGPFQNWPQKGSVHWHLWPVESLESTNMTQ